MNFGNEGKYIALTKVRKQFPAEGFAVHFIAIK